jgi:hypothetical protein
MTARARQLGHDSLGDIQDTTAGSRQREKIAETGQPGWDSRYGTAGIRQLGQGIQDRTAGTGHPGQESKDSEDSTKNTLYRAKGTEYLGTEMPGAGQPGTGQLGTGQLGTGQLG